MTLNQLGSELDLMVAPDNAKQQLLGQVNSWLAGNNIRPSVVGVRCVWQTDANPIIFSIQNNPKSFDLAKQVNIYSRSVFESPILISKIECPVILANSFVSQSSMMGFLREDRSVSSASYNLFPKNLIYECDSLPFDEGVRVMTSLRMPMVLPPRGERHALKKRGVKGLFTRSQIIHHLSTEMAVGFKCCYQNYVSPLFTKDGRPLVYQIYFVNFGGAYVYAGGLLLASRFINVSLSNFENVSVGRII